MSKMVINEEFLTELDALQMHIRDNVSGMFGGNRKSKSHGSSCEFDDFRDYAPGDDVSKIDWNAYARHDRLFLKLFLDERRMHNRIYIDASRSMAHGRSEKSDQALRIAAAIAYLSISQLDKVSIYCIKEGSVYAVAENVVGKDAFLSVVGKLNEIEFEGDSYISEAILPEKVGFGDGMSVIISDFLTDNDFIGAIDYLVSKKRHVFCVQVLSSEELNPALRGKVHLFDSENIDRTYRKNIDRDIIAAYREALAYVTARVSDACTAREADYMLAPDTASMAELFLHNMVDMGVLK